MPKATFSTEDINSFGFRVRTGGIKLERFQKNPVITFGHATDKMSVGKAIAIAVVNNNLVGDVEFDLEDEMGKALDRKYSKGYMNGYSVGVRPIHFNWDEKIPILEESELMEIAAATVPSNENAIQLYNEAGEMVNLSFFKETKKTDMKNIAILLGLLATATEADIEKSITDLKALAAAKEAEAKNLSEQLKVIRDAEKTEKLKRLDLALNNPKKNLSDIQKNHYKKLAETDVDTVINLVNDLPEVKNLHSVPGSEKKPKYEGKTFEQLMKEDPAYLAKLKVEDPDTYMALREAYLQK